MADEKIRILICHTCESIQELPWFEGSPENDDTLNYRLAEHRFSNGDEHIGIMGTVLESDWRDEFKRKEISRKIAEAAGRPGTGEGLGETFYDVKSNFQHDAFTCWKQHNRTLDCGDYQSKAKLLMPDTRAERKAEGLDPSRRPTTYLCDFCPVHQHKIQLRNSEKFGYNY